MYSLSVLSFNKNNMYNKLLKLSVVHFFMCVCIFLRMSDLVALLKDGTSMQTALMVDMARCLIF